VENTLQILLPFMVWLMLVALGIQDIHLLSNNPKKSQELRELGINVINTKKTGVFANNDNLVYLMAKAMKTAHAIDLSKHCQTHANYSRESGA